ncbi:MAG: anti-sigma factor family protein [Armatimonadota bacterium]
MQCRRIENLLSAFLDGELDRDEAWAVENHLARCAACREEYRSLQATKHVLASLARRSSRSELERLLATDVGTLAREAAHYPVSPRTVAAALLSIVGLWAASRQLARSDDRLGPPLPEQAYRPVVVPPASPQAYSTNPSTSCLLVVGSPAPDTAPLRPGTYRSGSSRPGTTLPAAYFPSSP